MPDVLLIGGVAEHLSHKFGVRVTPKQVRSVIERGKVSEPGRLGPFRVFTPEQLPAVEAAMRQAGYLPAAEAAHA